jgi:hypothetical protein
VVPKVTWLTPYWDDWIARFGGKPPGGALAKTLKPLHDEHGETVVRAAWRRFLTENNAQYISIPKFGMTFGSWTGAKPQTLGRGDKSWVDAADWTRE